MTGYYIDNITSLSASICEVSYEKRAKVMVVGMKKVRDIVGEQYWVPSKADGYHVYDELKDAIEVVKKHALQRRQIADELLAQLEKATVAK